MPGTPGTYFDRISASRAASRVNGTPQSLARSTSPLQGSLAHAKRRYFFQTQAPEVGSTLRYSHYDVLVPVQFADQSQKQHMQLYYADYLDVAREAEGQFAASRPMDSWDVKELTKWVSEVQPRSRTEAYPLLVLVQNLLRDILADRHKLFLEELDKELATTKVLGKEHGEEKARADRLAASLASAEEKLADATTKLAATKHALDALTRQTEAGDVKNRATIENLQRQLENMENSLASTRHDRDRYIAKAKDATDQLGKVFLEKDKALAELRACQAREEAAAAAAEGLVGYSQKAALATAERGPTDDQVREVNELIAGWARAATGARNAYIGELRRNEQGAKVITYVAATKENAFVVGRALEPEKAPVSYEAVAKGEAVAVKVEEEKRVCTLREDAKRVGAFAVVPIKLPRPPGAGAAAGEGGAEGGAASPAAPSPAPSGGGGDSSRPETPAGAGGALAASSSSSSSGAGEVVGVLAFDRLEAPGPGFSGEELRAAERLAGLLGSFYAQLRSKRGELDVGLPYVDEAKLSPEQRLKRRVDFKSALEKDMADARVNEIREMKKYNSPPKAVLEIWKAVFIVLGNKELAQPSDPASEWAKIRQLIVTTAKSPADTVIGKMKEYDPTKKEELAVAAGEKFAHVAKILKATPREAAEAASQAAVAVHAWLTAVVDIRDMARQEAKRK
eukprot:tig00000204_g17718.t1